MGHGARVGYLARACAVLGLLLTVPGLALPAGMVWVPAGWFTMGADEGPRSNQPPHAVYVHGFALDRTEVTVAAYQAFWVSTARGARAVVATPGPTPARGVTWADARSYCVWVGKRLPTEAEWEKAARGVDGRRFPWGPTWRPECANTRETGAAGVLPVGSFPSCPSPYGALDLAGNVTEWVNDYYDPAYYAHSPRLDPPGPTQVMDHVSRGGSYATTWEYAQTFRRNSSHSALPNWRVGFRCAWRPATNPTPFPNNTHPVTKRINTRD